MLIVSLLVPLFLINYYTIDFVLKYVTIVGFFFGILMSLYTLYMPKLPGYLDEQGVINILKVASNDSFRNHLIVTLILQYGLILSDVLNLKVEDTDFGNKKIKIVESEGKKDKYVLITTELIMEIRYYLMVQNIEAGYIFPQERSKVLQEGAHN